MNRNAAWSLMAAMGSFAFVAAGATNTFEAAESTTPGERPTGWTGYCAVSNQVGGTYAKTPPGNPASDAAHDRVLWVEGSAACEYAEGGNRVVDLLVMAEEWPDEELPAADGNEQIKFAFDTNGYVNLYHKLASDSASAQWSVVSSEAIAAGTWVRTTFTFDYDSNLCQLKLDGSPCVSEYGYRSADNLTHPGSWYYMATNASSLASIDFVGCGGVDDVINAAKGSYTPAHSGDTATNGVDYAWFDKNGLAWSDPDATAAPGGSGYTLKESFQAGTDPNAAEKLYVTNASYSASQLVLTINGCGPTYEVQKSATPFTDGVSGGESAGGTFTTNATDNTTTWTGTFPSDNLTYYRVRNVSAATAETVNQFAIKKITSSSANTLVALPWKSLSANVANPANITAANVVMTNNLVNGDWLLYYDGGYKGWCLSNGVWTPTSIANLSGIEVTAASANAELARGQAIWLVRPGSRDLSQPFYLYGQYQSALGSTDVSSGGSLLASPDMANEFTISTSTVTGVDGDRIIVPSASPNEMPRTYEKKDSAWGYWAEETTTVGGRPLTTQTWTTSGDGMKVPVGQGFKYVTGSGSGSRSIAW